MSCKMGNFMNLRVFALLGVLLLAGCSGLSVRHLPSNPWKNEASQNIQMRYLAFQYQVIPVGNELGIVAEAYPVIDKLPDWASWYGEIMLSVYVSDEYGRVLASKDTVLVPRPLNREAGLPLEVSLDRGTNRHQPLYGHAARRHGGAADAGIGKGARKIGVPHMPYGKGRAGVDGLPLFMRGEAAVCPGERGIVMPGCRFL